MIFDEEMKQLEDYDAGMGTEAFKCKEGKNKVRILSGGTPIAQHWVTDANGKEKAIVCYGMTKGCPYHKLTEKKPQIQHAFYLLDKSKADPAIQLSYMPYSVMKHIKAYSEEEGYEFTELPMPYDISITFDPKESPATMYKTIASPKQEPVSEEVLKELAKKKPVADIVSDRKEKARKADQGEKQASEKGLPVVDINDDEEIDPEEIPF
jgi:hypothetical protein